MCYYPDTRETFYIRKNQSIGFLAISAKPLQKAFVFWLLFIAILIVHPENGFAGVFQGLGFLPGGGDNIYSQAFDVSADGSVVVGRSSCGPSCREAFRWSESTGMISLGKASNALDSMAFAVSADGSVVVGENIYDSGDFTVFRWTQDGGMINLGEGRVGDVSNDGSVVVGGGYGDNAIAWRWTAESGKVYLGFLPEAALPASGASDVSGDGTIVVGGAINASGYSEPFRWTSIGGMVGLGSRHSALDSTAVKISADGSTVVGVSGAEIFYWTSIEGMKSIGAIPGCVNSFPYGISANGSVIVGSTSCAGFRTAFIWDNTNGMRSLKDVIEDDYGIDITDWWYLDAAMAVVGVDNSLVVVGFGLNPLAQQEGWIVRLEADTDGDGLLDTWENEGIDINGDGTVDLDLPALGADPNHKDLFIEVDRMAGVPFSQNAIDMVRDSFAVSPVENPDEIDGINLHVIVDEMIPLQATIDFMTFDVIKDQSFGTVYERSNPNWVNILEAKKRAFRYCLFANCFFDGSLGKGEYFGNDFVVAHGCSSHNSDYKLASTFMHELGHNLGLGHGGADKINYKPNYISVMNYGFDAFTDVWGNSLPLDYCRQPETPLDESNLDETIGITSSEYPNVLTIHGYPRIGFGVDYAYVQLNVPHFDWNHDGNLEAGVEVDLNYLGSSHPLLSASSPSPGQILNSYNDWELIHLSIGSTGEYVDYVHNTIGEKDVTEEILIWHDTYFPEPPTWTCLSDRNTDGDVDGADVVYAILHPNLVAVDDIASEFGKIGCHLQSVD
jgi:probable HAF family extracellular repeat protein